MDTDSTVVAESETADAAQASSGDSDSALLLKLAPEQNLSDFLGPKESQRTQVA